jgi:GTP-binding protein
MQADEQIAQGRINQLLGFKGLERVPLEEAEAGDIVIISGLDDINIGVTISDKDTPKGLPMLSVDEPTLTMDFHGKHLALAGTEGKFVTSRQIRERLDHELLTNVALRVEDTADADIFRVSGRGELHLTILLENMRREGFEMAVAKPRVVFKDINGEKCEPYENLTVDMEDNPRRGDGRIGPPPWRIGQHGKRWQRPHPFEYQIPARGLIGFQGEFMTMTRGTGLMSHVFDDYAPVKPDMPGRHNGVLVSQEQGEAVAYALWNLEDRGRMFVSPATKSTKA